ncbi:Asparagine synthetase [Lunatimonas lonarensis]|uniref:asparagine synthase (glutamine-hydrolyzing) n=1 Tax=Lunatimonas lonarensis TaxID=1232681 RepID=R7ZY34_9BACT|nr:asparagine synthase-related protein [Lunatimonas lonarensis]EON78977.1 Asparagine synthetase [Lunatimonas lonarensis]
MNVYVGCFSPNQYAVTDRYREISKGEYREFKEFGQDLQGGGFGLLVHDQADGKIPFKLISTLYRGGLFILTESRLDNRDFLIKKLGERELWEPGVENAVIVYHAFRKWGASFVDHLDGDWSVMIFNTEKKELVIAVDHLATRSVFFSKQSDGFLFSNSKKVLLDAIGDKVPLNRQFILRRLLISRISSPETCHQGIFPVPPGHVLRVSESGTVDKRRYWFFDRVKPVEFQKEEDYLEAFLEVYRQAVRERIIPGVTLGSHLSGGLDSGSVSALAAEHLRVRGRSLLSFTGTTSAVPKESMYKFEDEAYYAGLTAQHAGNIEQHVCTGTSYPLLESIGYSVDTFQELSHGIGNLHWIYEISDRAKQAGVNLMLVGQQGNATVSWQGEKAATWKSSLKEVAKEVYWDKIQGGKSLVDFRKIPRCYVNNPNDTVINREFLSSFSFRDLLREESDELDNSLPPGVGRTRYDLMGLRNNQISVFWQTLSQKKGLIHWDPTNDAGLMEFCLGIPEEFYRRGMRRHLIRQSMKNLLPDEVAFNSKKGLQSADWQERFQKEQVAFRELLSALGPSHPVRNYIDIPSLIRKMDRFLETPGMLSGEISRAFGLIFLTEKWE